MSFSKFIFNQKMLFNNLKKIDAPKICAMVKANAYGIGLKQVCKSLFGKVEYFGVSNLDEALAIREFNKYTKILIVGITKNFSKAIENNISITIENYEQILILEKLINKYKIKNKKINIHLKINSGMNRFGEKNIKLIKKIIKKLIFLKNINFEGIYTHFSTAKIDTVFFIKQLSFFNKVLKFIPPIFNPIIHFGGSEVLGKINFKNYQNSMVRVGIDLYKNVVKIESKIVKIFTLLPNERLGYSNGFIASKRHKVGIIPLGYADGINRKLSNIAFVKINNNYCKIIGNICMDTFFIDLSNTDCKLGDTVEVFFSENYWAEICQTIPYEILTNLNYKRMNYLVKY